MLRFWLAIAVAALGFSWLWDAAVVIPTRGWRGAWPLAGTSVIAIAGAAWLGGLWQPGMRMFSLVLCLAATGGVVTGNWLRRPRESAVGVRDPFLLKHGKTTKDVKHLSPKEENGQLVIRAGVMGEKGKVISRGAAESAGTFGMEGIIVRRAGKEDCMDLNGEVLFGWKYDQVIHCSLAEGEPQTAIVRLGIAYQLVKLDGTLLREIPVARIIRTSESNYANRLLIAERAGRFGFLDRDSGQDATEFNYDDARAAKEWIHTQDRQAPVRVGPHWGVIDGFGNYLVEPAYQDAQNPDYIQFQYGAVWLKKDDKWGFYDMLSKAWVIPPSLPTKPPLVTILVRSGTKGWSFGDKPITDKDRWKMNGGTGLQRAN